MKFKIILISLIMIISISAVYSENETGTFLDIQNEIDTGAQIIYLNNTNYIGEGHEIIINRDVVLDGSDKTGIGESTLNANGLSRIFTILPNNYVILKNLNLINGNTKENGGAILFNSTGQLALYLCTFTNNVANNGGSIYTTEGTVISHYTNFTNNKCLENGEAIFSQKTLPELAYCQLNTDTIYTNAKIIENTNVSDSIIDSEVELYFGKNKLGFVGDDNYTLLMYQPLYNGTFPEKFDLREYGYVGPVRNQGSTGTCWAHATIGSLESAILKASNGTILDKNEGLSVANMIDTIRKYITPAASYGKMGSEFNVAASGFISWLGPTRYNNAPFLGYYIEPTIFPNMVHVQNIMTIWFYNVTLVKQALMDYGALYTNAATSNGADFSLNNYYPEYTRPDHGVVLVGWDDNYSRYKFAPVNGEYPAGDGAWIVKNSWGEKWADDGYCYISYYDGNYLHQYESVFAFIFNDTIRFNKNYQNTLSGKGVSSSTYEDTIEDNFTAADDDYLAAFSTFFWRKCNYTASIYINNNLVLKQTGIQDLSGYFTIELDKYIPIKKGDLFRISIQFTGLTGEPYAIYETSDRVPFVRGFTTRALIESIQNRIDYAKTGDEIFLNNKTYYSSEGEKTIIINKNITINGAKSNGEGFSTINATYLNSVFEIANGCSLTLKNVNIINSKATAIIINKNGIASILNCNFTNNIGENGNSIAVYGQATIENCIINNENTGIGEIYVSGIVSLKNNKIKSTTAGIYNNGIINTETNLVFNDIITYVNVPTKITALLTDDSENSINSNSNVNLDNFGQMTFENHYWTFDYIPTTTEEKVLGGSLNFENINIQNGLLTVNANAPLLITGGTFSYGNLANVKLTLRTDKLGLYDVYVDNNKINTYSATSPASTISLPQMTVGTHTIKIVSISDSSYSNTATVKIVPSEVNLEVRARNINYGEQSTIEVTLKDNDNQPLEGGIKVTLCDKTYNLDLINGKARFNITERYDVNEYPVIATFEGNTNYLPVTAQTTMRVSKITPKFEITVEDFYTDSFGLCTIIFDESVTGLVELHAAPYKLTNAYLSNGKLIYNMRMKENGPREFYFDYHGNKNYYPTKSQSVYFYVMERGVLEIIGGTFDYGENVNITLITPETGDIDVYIDGNKKGRYSASSTKLTIDLVDLSCGVHTIKAEYVDDTSKTCEGTVTINKFTPSLEITTNNPQYGENLIINLELKDTNKNGIDSQITLTFNDHDYIVHLTNGMGSVEIFEKLNAGNYIIVAKFDGNINYNEVTSKQTTTIEKITPTITLDFENIEYDDTFNVIANINSDATGTITFFIDNIKSESIPIINGKAKYNQDNLDIGEHVIYAIYIGNNNYKTLMTETSQFIVAGNSEIYVKGGKFDYGNIPYIFVKTNTKTDINVYINNEKLGTYEVNSNGLQINLPISDVDTYNIYVEYAGDNSKNSITTVEIQKITPKINIITNNINYGETLKIDIELKGANNNPLNGDIILKINEKIYPIHISQGKGTIEITDCLNAKTYSIITSFSEDSNYKSTSIQKSVTISKITPTIDLTTENLDINSPFTAIATIINSATGTVEFYLDGKNIGSNQINNGQAKFILTTLESGTHNLYAKYTGNTNYNPAKSYVLSFNVEAQGFIIITTEKFEYGQPTYVTIKTSEDTSVNVYVDNEKIGTYSISRNGTKITLPTLNIGIHTIKAEYTYNTVVNSQTTLEILRVKPILKLNVTNANYRSSYGIAIEISGIPVEDLADSLIVLIAKINNVPYQVYLTNGKGSITVYEILNAGDYVVSVTFPGSSSYQSVTVEEILTIYPINPEITINTDNLKVSENSIITVNIKNEATGYINLYVDGEKVGSENIINNQVNFNVTSLQAGNHQIYVHYTGDTNYNEYITPITSITLNSQGSLTIIGGTFKHTEDVYITIKNSKTSNVNVYVDGEKIGTYSINTNGIKLNIGKLTIGNHNIKVEYADNPTVNNYATVEIQKITPTITLTVKEVEFEEIFTAIATVNTNVTGTVEFYIDNTKVGTIQINNGKAIFTTNTLIVGSHTIYAKYIENDKYNAAQTTTLSFNIEERLTITVTGGNFTTLEEVSVIIKTNKLLELNVYVDNNKYGTYTILSDTLKVPLLNLSAKTHTIKVESLENPLIYAEAIVKINKVIPTLTIDTNDVILDIPILITINSPYKLNGTVEIYLNNVKYDEITITNGVAKYYVNGLTVGEYSAYAKYVESSKFDTAVSNTDTFSVNEINGIFTVGGKFKYLTTPYITLQSTKDTLINIYIDNNLIKTIKIGKNTCKLDLPLKDVGIYNIKVEDVEDTTLTAQTTVEITKITTNINLTVESNVYGENTTITTLLNNNTSGTVDIYLNNTKVATVQINNGKALYSTKLNVCPYSVYAVYNGDNNFENATSELKSFNVDKKQTQLSISVDKFIHNQNGTIIVSVSPSQVTGEILLIINNNATLTQTIHQGVAVFNVKLTAGKHLIQAICVGDNNYINSTVNKTINVEKLNGEMTKEVIIDSKNNVKIKVNVPKDDNNNISIIINDKKISIKISNGVGTVDLGILDAGKYNFKIQYEGKYYNIKNIEDNFTISKKDAGFDLTTKDLTMYFKDGSKVIATLKDNAKKGIAGEKVAIVINGETYSRTTDKNGQASITINLNPGTYTIQFKYNNTIVKSIVTIKSTVVASDLVKYYKNDTQYTFKVLDSKGNPSVNQKVQLNINGVFYNRTTNNQGIAKLNINLNPGKYIITIINLNNFESHSNNITVLSKIKANDLVKYFCNNSQYELQVLDDNGKPLANQIVSLNINGVLYTRTTNAQGIAKMTINLGVGEYTVTATCGNSITSNKIKVLSKIKSENIIMSKNNRKPFKITTLDDNGKPVSGKFITFNINGVIYNRITDKNGIAQLNINLNPGEYIITTIYEKQMTSNKVTVMG